MFLSRGLRLLRRGQAEHVQIPRLRPRPNTHLPTIRALKVGARQSDRSSKTSEGQLTVQARPVKVCRFKRRTLVAGLIPMHGLASVVNDPNRRSVVVIDTKLARRANPRKGKSGRLRRCHHLPPALRRSTGQNGGHGDQTNQDSLCFRQGQFVGSWVPLSERV